MNPALTPIRVLAGAASLALLVASGFATAQVTGGPGASTTAPSRNDLSDAQKLVCDAVASVQKMGGDPGIQRLLQRSRGVFVVPKYGSVALGVGARGGKGVLLVRRGSQWSDPALYNIGGISVGLQAGAEGGTIAMVLNNQKAVNSFNRENNWSLNADAGLTIVNWSPKAEASAGRGDVVVWAETKGLLGSVAVSVTDIKFNSDETAALYGKNVAVADILNGKVTTQAPQVATLKQTLPGSAGSTAMGSSGMAGSQGASTSACAT